MTELERKEAGFSTVEIIGMVALMIGVLAVLTPLANTLGQSIFTFITTTLGV